MLVHNERLKYLATLFNTLASAIVITGLFAPSFAIIYGFYTGKIEISLLQVSLVFLTCIFLATLLHLFARYILGGLKS